MRDSGRVRALRAQLIDRGEYIIIRRGLVQVKVAGSEAARITAALYTRSRGTLTREQLLHTFETGDRAATEDLLDNLLTRRLFVMIPAPTEEPQESPLDVFYWHFGDNRKERIESCRIIIVGLNSVTLQCAKTIRMSGFKHITIVDDPHLRDEDRGIDLEGLADAITWAGQGSPENMPVSDADCIIAASSFGGQNHLRSWNRFCVGRRIVFAPALLHDCVGEIGPIVVPGQSACLECLRGRQNSHLENLHDSRQADITAFEGRDIVAHHPAMSNIVGNMPALEVTKFVGLKLLGQVNRYIEMRLLLSQMVVHRVLKLPYCEICGSLQSFSPIDLFKSALRPRDNTDVGHV